MSFDVFNSIVLAGIIQGIIFGIVVLSNIKYRWMGTLFLAAFIISFSLDNLQFYVEDVGLITETQLMTGYFIPFQMLSGPLFLLYGLYLFNPDRKFKRVQWLLFLPFIIALLASTAFKYYYAVTPYNESIEVFYYYLERGLEFTSLLLDISILGYLLIETRGVRRQENNAPRMQLKWFRNVLVSIFILSMIWLYITIEDYFYESDYWYVVYIGMSLTIYWMGHVGIYKYGIYEERKKIRNYSIENKTSFIPLKQKNEHIIALENILVNEKRFLDATLTLDTLADELHLSKSHLSRIINTELQMGFPEYLNNMRVAEAKTYLRNPAFANYTLVAIGLEAGFNSKTTFNTVFKKITTMTPSEFRNGK